MFISETFSQVWLTENALTASVQSILSESGDIDIKCIELYAMPSNQMGAETVL